MITIERGSILRLFFSLLTIHTWYCGMFDTKTLHYMVTTQAGELGSVIIMLFGSLGLVALADSFVNDFMPRQYSMKTLMKFRHLVFMIIAIMNSAELYVAVQYVQSWGLTFYCLLITTFVVITAFSDIKARFPGFKHARS